MNKPTTTKVLGAALGVASMLALAAPASATLKCQRELAKNSAKYAQARSKELAKCEEANLKDATAIDCVAAANAPGSKVDKVKTKTIDKIVSKCAGTEKDGAFGFGRCPISEGVSLPDGTDCSDLPGLVTNEQDIADCLTCVAAEHTDELNELLYGGPSAPVDEAAIDCRIAIGKETSKYFKARSKAMLKCEDAILKGKIPGPCPDAEKAAPKIAKAEGKKVAKICAACNTNEVCPLDTLDLRCSGGPNAEFVCTTNADCPGGYTCAPQILQKCQGTSAPSLLGTECELAGDCNKCSNSASANDLPCGNAAGCRICVGGSNAGAACTTGSQCPGGACPNQFNCVGGSNAGAICTVASECPGGACGPRTCGGGQCFSDGDISTANLGFAVVCPPIVANNPNQGNNDGVADIIACVDRAAGERVDCLDALGASVNFSGLPSQCTNPAESCESDFNTVVVTVALNFPSTLAVCVGGTVEGDACTVDGDCDGGGFCVAGPGGVQISLGYEDVVTIPGTGDVGPRDAALQGGFIQSNDLNEHVVTSYTASPGSGFVVGDAYTMMFDTCGPPVSAANFACQVRGASNAAGGQLSEGVSCSVSSVL